MSVTLSTVINTGPQPKNFPPRRLKFRPDLLKSEAGWSKSGVRIFGKGRAASPLPTSSRSGQRCKVFHAFLFNCLHFEHQFRLSQVPWRSEEPVDTMLQSQPEPMSVKPYSFPVVRSTSSCFFSSISSTCSAHSLYDQLSLSLAFTFWAIVSNDCSVMPGLPSNEDSHPRIVRGQGRSLNCLRT